MIFVSINLNNDLITTSFYTYDNFSFRIIYVKMSLNHQEPDQQELDQQEIDQQEIDQQEPDQQDPDINIHLKYRKRKKYFETTSRSSINISKANLREATAKLNVFYKQYNLELASVVLRETDSEAEPFEMTIVEKVEESKPKKIKTIDAVKIKDTAHISEKNYKMIHEYCNEFIPPISSVITMTRLLNGAFTIYENKFGYFNNIKEKLYFIMRYYLKYNENFFQENVVKIKICADGFQATKKGRTLLNVSFSIIHGRTNPYSSDGHFLIGNLDS